MTTSLPSAEVVARGAVAPGARLLEDRCGRVLPRHFHEPGGPDDGVQLGGRHQEAQVGDGAQNVG